MGLEAALGVSPYVKCQFGLRGFSITISPRSSASPGLTVKSSLPCAAIRPFVEKW